MTDRGGGLAMPVGRGETASAFLRAAPRAWRGRQPVGRLPRFARRPVIGHAVCGCWPSVAAADWRSPIPDDRPWSSDLGAWTLDLGAWSLELGARSSELGARSLDFRLQTSDFRLQTSDFRLQTSDFRRPASKAPIRPERHVAGSRAPQAPREREPPDRRTPLNRAACPRTPAAPPHARTARRAPDSAPDRRARDPDSRPS